MDIDTSPRTFFIAGVKFRPDYMMVLKGLRDSGLDRNCTTGVIDVELKGEPKNPHDRYAVKCLIGSTHVGYVPKPINVDIWALHDAGYSAKGRLTQFNPDYMTHQLFQVTVTFTKKPSSTAKPPGPSVEECREADKQGIRYDQP